MFKHTALSLQTTQTQGQSTNHNQQANFTLGEGGYVQALPSGVFSSVC